MGKGHTRFTLMPHWSNDISLQENGWGLGQLWKTLLTHQCSACSHEPAHPGEQEWNQSQSTCGCSQGTAADQDKTLSRCFLVVWLFFLGFVCLFGIFYPFLQIFWTLNPVWQRAFSCMVWLTPSSCSGHHLLLCQLQSSSFVIQVAFTWWFLH